MPVLCTYLDAEEASSGHLPEVRTPLREVGQLRLMEVEKSLMSL